MDNQPTGVSLDDLVAMLDQNRVWVTLDRSGEPRRYTVGLRKAIASACDGQTVRRLSVPIVVSGDQVAALRAAIEAVKSSVRL